MKTRQLRLNSEDQIKLRIKDFFEKEISVVLRDKTVLLGRVTKIEASALELTNLRRKAMSIPFAKISELYFDIKE
jgi:hypothetical protein